MLSLASDDVHSRSSLEPLTGHDSRSRFWGHVVPVLPRAGIPGRAPGRDQGNRPGGSRVRPDGPNATVEAVRPGLGPGRPGKQATGRTYYRGPFGKIEILFYRT